MTPREDADAELLALEASGEIVAPSALYDRVVVELAAIRASEPAVAEISPIPPWWPSSILVNLDDEGVAAYEEGTYQAWACPNELYGATEIEAWSLPLGIIAVRFAGIYDVNQVGEDYLALEHVVHVEPDLTIGSGPDVCLSIDGDVHTYIFDDARGDCPAGCTEHLYTGFTVDLDGTITALGSFDPAEPVPAPAWFENASDCTMHL